MQGKGREGGINWIGKGKKGWCFVEGVKVIQVLDRGWEGKE